MLGRRGVGFDGSVPLTLRTRLVNFWIPSEVSNLVRIDMTCLVHCSSSLSLIHIIRNPSNSAPGWPIYESAILCDSYGVHLAP